jgi:hypothetical protein
MKVEIEVKNKAEAERIKMALDDSETRAFVNVVGALLPFGKRAQKRILTFVADKVQEGSTHAD